jgi:outer membrane protein assembly factor BamB
VVILVLAVVAHGVNLAVTAQDHTIQIFALMGILSATVLALGIWWAFFSRLTWAARGIGIALVLVFCGVFRATVRVKDVRGEMIPMLTWSWNKTAEERAAQFRAANAPAQPVVAVAGAAEEPELPLAISEADWPEFRGRNRDGVVLHSSLRRDWGVNPPRLRWKHPIGLGWSSFAIVDGLAFTQEQRLEDEAVVCYDVETGKELWAHTDAGRFTHPVGGTGPRATPTVFDGRVYTLGATGILNCLDPRSGRKIWSRNILADAQVENVEYGMSGSPLVYNAYEGLVVVNPGGPQGHGVAAYNQLTGKPVWSAGNGKASYASPQVSVVGGSLRLLMFDAEGLAIHDRETGTEICTFPWTNGPAVNAMQPILVGDDKIFIGNGYTVGSALIRATQQNGNWSLQEVWKTKQLKLKFNCAVERNGFLYGLDEGILSCFDAATGKRKWKEGRYGYGQMLVVDDVLLIQAETGEVVLVEASPDAFREIARFQALEGKTWNHPVLYKGLLVVRNGEEAACYEVSAAEAAHPESADLQGPNRAELITQRGRPERTVETGRNATP